MSFVWLVNGSGITSGFGLSSIVYSFKAIGNATLRVDVSNPIDTLSKEVTIPVIDGENAAGTLVKHV